MQVDELPAESATICRCLADFNPVPKLLKFPLPSPPHQQQFHALETTVLDCSLYAVPHELPQIVKRTTPEVRLMIRHLGFYGRVAKDSSLLGYDAKTRVFGVHLATILLLTDVIHSTCLCGENPPSGICSSLNPTVLTQKHAGHTDSL
jgi:hypothetical protein